MYQYYSDVDGNQRFGEDWCGAADADSIACSIEGREESQLYRANYESLRMEWEMVCHYGEDSFSCDEDYLPFSADRPYIGGTYEERVSTFNQFLDNIAKSSEHEPGHELASDRQPNVKVAKVSILSLTYADERPLAEYWIDEDGSSVAKYRYTESTCDGEPVLEGTEIDDQQRAQKFEEAAQKLKDETDRIMEGPIAVNIQWKFIDGDPATINFTWKGDAPADAALPQKMTRLLPYDKSADWAEEGRTYNSDAIYTMPDTYKKGDQIKGEQNGKTGTWTFKGWSLEDDAITYGELKDKFVLWRDHNSCNCFKGFEPGEGKIWLVTNHKTGSGYEKMQVCDEGITPIFLAKWKSDKRPPDEDENDTEDYYDWKFKFTVYGTWEFKPDSTDSTNPTDPTKPTDNQGGNTGGNDGGNTGGKDGGNTDQCDNGGGDKSSGSSGKATGGSAKTGDNTLVEVGLAMMMAACAAAAALIRRRRSDS